MGIATGVGIAATGAQTVLDAYGQKKAAATAKRQDLIAQTVARNQAADAIALGGNMAAEALGQGSREAGKQRNQIAGKNFEIGTGTAQDITDATDLVSSVDAYTIRQNASREATGYLTNAYSAGAAAKAVNPAPAIAGNLLSGASSVAQQWYNRKR
jgi:hypothetical protein